METTGVKQYKYSVLTYVFGDGEILREIDKMDENVEYICVTDNTELMSNTWTIVVDNDLDGKTIFDKVFSVRYNLFKYCHSDICVRVDGSIKVKQPLNDIVDAFIKSDADICVEIHPYRNDLLVEYHCWLVGRGYPIDKIQNQIRLFQLIGHDVYRKGLIQLNFSINKRSDITDKIDKLMYGFLKYLGETGDVDRLDQTVFSVVLDKFFNGIKVFAVGEDLLHSKYLSWNFHNEEKEIPWYPEYCCEPYLMNKPIEINSF